MAAQIRYKIRELRESRGWTQTELAERAGVKQQTVSELELGQNNSIKALVLVARALGVTLDQTVEVVEE